MKRRDICLTGMLLAMAVGLAATSHAEEEGGWNYKITPYLWAMGVDGDIGVGNVTVPVDVDFADAIKDLEIGGMLAVEANKDKWSVLLDGTYLNLDSDADTAFGKVRAELEQVIVQGNILYLVTKQDAFSLELGLGGRYFDVDLDVNVPSDDRPDISRSEGWIDPLLVLRAKYQFAQRCFMVLMGDVGGFGAESDLTSQGTLAAGYSIREDMNLLLGYRYLYYDYDKDGFSYDVADSGVAVGLQFNL